MYGNEIVTMSARELHALITNAVKEGVLAAMKESGKGLYPDSERPAEKCGLIEPQLVTQPGSTDNARAHLGVVRKRLDTYCDYMVSREAADVMSSMMAILSDEEVRYILTHLSEGYKPTNTYEFRQNSETLLQWYTEHCKKK